MVEEYAGGMPLDHRERLRLCLLIEEALGMICGIMDGAEGTIWMDGWGGETRIHIDVSAKPNPIQREALASVASNGQSEGGRSFMRTLGAFIADFRNHVRDRLGSILNRGVTENDAGSEWSLKTYRNHLDDQSDETHAALSAGSEQVHPLHRRSGTAKGAARPGTVGGPCPRARDGEDARGPTEGRGSRPATHGAASRKEGRRGEAHGSAISRGPQSKSRRKYDKMKRVLAACFLQTLHFQLKEDMPHDVAVILLSA